MKTNFEKKVLPVVTFLAYAAFFVTMCWLHHRQLCVENGFASDLPQHLEEALRGKTYTAAYLLVPPVYALAGEWGMAVLLALFQLAALVVFAWGLRAAAPKLSAGNAAAAEPCGEPGPGGLDSPRGILVHRHS